MTAVTAEAGRRAATRGGRSLAGTPTLVRFVLRRERVRLSVWILGIVGFTVVTVASLPGLYMDAASRQARAELLHNPGLRAISGPGYGLDDYTFGAMIGMEFVSWTAIFVVLMSIFTVVRHLRGEEETGRAELVQSSPVGRHAMLTAVLLVAVGANLATGVLVALGVGGMGIEGAGWGSSLLLGASLAAVGAVFAGVGAVTAQVSQHARGANGLAGAIFAASFLVRAAGDMAAVGGNWLSWLSPLGWSQQTRMYVDDRWWPLLLSVAATAVLAALAYRLRAGRDIGAGLVATRPGRGSAPARLSSPLGLAWRLHRASVVWWGVAIFLSALAYGGLASQVERFVTEVAVIEDAIAEIGGSVIDAWLAVIILVIGVVVAVFAAITALRARAEEGSGRAEPVLAASVSRSAWLGSHLVVSLAGAALLMLLAGVGLGISVSVTVGDAGLFGRVVLASLVHVPGIWVITGIAVVLFGAVPRAVPLVWLVVTYVGVVGWLGVLLGFPQWAMDLSPMGHTPLLPAAPMRWTPVVLLTMVAVALVGAGLAAFRRRDLQTTA